MPLDPKNIAVQVALRTMQLEGTDQATLAEAYLAGYTALDGAEVPAYALIDAIVASEAMLADLIAGDRQSPYRMTLRAISDTLVTDSPIPTIPYSVSIGLPIIPIPPRTDEDMRFIGVFSGVFDAADHSPLFEGSAQEIVRFWRRGGYQTEIRKYVLTAARLLHTRPGAYIEGCAFSRKTALGRLDVDSTELSPMPAAFESIWVASTISYLVKEGWLGNEAGYYGTFAQASLAMIRNRALNLPTLPSFQSTADPVSN